MTIDTIPRAYATLTGPTATFTATDGHDELLAASGDEDIRQMVLQRAANEARHVGAPFELITRGDRGDHHLLVAADGTLHPAPPAAASAAPENPVEPSADGAVSSQQGEEVKTDAPGSVLPGRDTAPEPPARPSFIAPAVADEPLSTGFRALLTRLGITTRAARAEVARRDSERAVSQQWAGCRTIAIANGKGGVGKTMTTAMLAAVFARYGGGNVLAWDNNDTRGTLGWRTEQGLYDSTIKDLLPAASALLAPHASVSDIARFVHHQPVDRYDVLRSNPELLAASQRLSTAEFDLLMQVAARYYRVVLFDSGNDESADRWLRMVDFSSQLVVPTITAPEAAESAALLLDALRVRDERSRSLADNAVVVVTESEPGARNTAARIADGFAGHVRTVERIPFDPALKSGPLSLDRLRPATRDAWVRVGAATARGL